MSKPLTFVLIFSFFFSCSYVIYDKFSRPKSCTQTVVVQANDTLWDIADGLDLDQDVRYVVQEIKKLNGLNESTIYPGQKLLVPGMGEQLLGMDIDNGDNRQGN